MRSELLVNTEGLKKAGYFHGRSNVIRNSFWLPRACPEIQAVRNHLVVLESPNPGGGGLGEPVEIEYPAVDLRPIVVWAAFAREMNQVTTERVDQTARENQAAAIKRPSTDP